MLVALELSPQIKSGEVQDFAVIASAYGKNGAQQLIDSSDILYVDPDKKRTDSWLGLLRLKLPSRLTHYGSISSITTAARDVNGNIIFGKTGGKTALQEAYKRAIAEKEKADILPVKKQFSLSEPVEQTETLLAIGRTADNKPFVTAEQRRGRLPNTGGENTVFAEDDTESFDFVGTTTDGIEVYEISEEVRQMPYKKRMEIFMDIMRNEYSGRTAKFTANGEVYYAKFDEADLRKNVYGDKKSSPQGWKARINAGADGDIFNLVENAQHSGSSAEQGKQTEAHRGLTGWEYFVKTIQIDGKVYNLLANVRKKPEGEYVYSIQLNENKKKHLRYPVSTRMVQLKRKTALLGCPQMLL